MRRAVALGFAFGLMVWAPAFGGAGESEAPAPAVPARDIPARAALTPAEQAELADVGDMRVALARATQLMEAARFDFAAAFLRRALELAGPTETELAGRVRATLEIGLPLAQARQYLISGYPEAADQVLRTAAAANAGDPARLAQISELLTQVAAVREAAARERQTGERTVLEQVAVILQRYRAEFGHYPPGFGELNRVLPPDRGPLTRFDIVSYQASGDRMSIVLRAKDNPENILNLHDTGLVR